MKLYRELQESNKEFIDRTKGLTKEGSNGIIYSYYKDRDEEFWLEDLDDNHFRSVK